MRRPSDVCRGGEAHRQEQRARIRNELLPTVYSLVVAVRWCGSLLDDIIRSYHPPRTLQHRYTHLARRSCPPSIPLRAHSPSRAAAHVKAQRPRPRRGKGRRRSLSLRTRRARSATPSIYSTQSRQVRSTSGTDCVCGCMGLIVTRFYRTE